MNAVMFSTWIVVGLLTAWLASIVTKDGGHGLVRDLVLGVIGSSAATAALTALDGASEVGLFATAFVAFAGAALVIIAQRKIWYEPSVDHRDAMAASPACAGMFVSRVYPRPGIGWAWTICPACAHTTKEVKVAA